jgi:DNA-binding response OmpR family regulator
MTVSKKTLIVEDYPLLAILIEDTLLRGGYRDFLSCGNADQALELISEHSFSWAILDYNLGPNLTSIPVAKKLKTLGVPFIFLSGYSEDTNITHTGLEEVARINKPFKAGELLSHAEIHLADQSNKDY